MMCAHECCPRLSLRAWRGKRYLYLSPTPQYPHTKQFFSILTVQTHRSYVQMLSLQCPLWESGHLSSCIQDTYLSVLVPVTACLFSSALLIKLQAKRCVHRRHGRGHDHEFSRISQSELDPQFGIHQEQE